MVSHSHSCGPAELGPWIIGFVWFPPSWTMLALLTMGRCWAMLKLPGIMPPGICGMLVPKSLAASFEPVELAGLSISMLAWLSPAALLLCLRCRFDDVLTFREPEEAPGPGAAFGGAAAMGTTPFPPMAAADEPVLP